MGISLSTLDRRIRSGDIKTVKRGHRVFVQVQGLEPVSDEMVMLRYLLKLEECQETVRELQQTVAELESERDEAWEEASGRKDAYEELEEAYRKEHDALARTRQWALRLAVAASTLLVLLATSILITWQLLT